MFHPMKYKSADSPLGTIAIDSIFTPIVTSASVSKRRRVGQKDMKASTINQ